MRYGIRSSLQQPNRCRPISVDARDRGARREKTRSAPVGPRASAARSLVGGGRGRSRRDEDPTANVVFDLTPSNGSTQKASEPNKESCGIPHHDQKHLLPESTLAQPPHADHRRHGNSQPDIGAEIAESHAERGMNRNRGQAPWQSLREKQPEMSPGSHMPHHHHPT